MNWVNKFFMFFCSLLVSCQTTSYRQVYIDLANKEINSFAKEVNKSDGLYLFGHTGEYLNGIRSIDLTFMSPESPTVEEARIQFYNVSRWFLTCINENESLRPFLSNFPFTIDNLTLYIIYSQQVDGSVSGVTMGETLEFRKRQGFIYYYGYDCTGAPIKIYEESYEDSLEKARNFQNKNPDFLLNPRSFSYSLKYLDKNKWISESIRTERESYLDNSVRRSSDEEEK